MDCSDQLLVGGFLPGEVHPININAAGLSVFGVYDVLMNARELFLSTESKPLNSDRKVFNANVDPYCSYMKVDASTDHDDEAISHNFIDITPAAGWYCLSRAMQTIRGEIFVPNEGGGGRPGGGRHDPNLHSKPVTDAGIDYGVGAAWWTDTEFRCAR